MSTWVGFLFRRLKDCFNDVFPVFKDFMARVFNIDVVILRSFTLFTDLIQVVDYMAHYFIIIGTTS